MKPSITFIIDHFEAELAGTERQLAGMIRALADRFDIDLVCLRDSEWLHGEGAALPCTTRVFQIDSVRRPVSYANIFRMVRYLRRRRPSVVHTFFPVGNIVGVLAAKLAGVPNVISSRRDYGEWMQPHYLAATRFANRFADSIITNSDQVKRLTERLEGVPGKKIDVVYNGIDVRAFARKPPHLELKRSLGIAEHHKVVGLIANYRPMKKQDTLVRAAELIVRRRDDISFVLVGRDAAPGEPRKAVQELAAQLGLQDRVRFAHADGNVADFLSILDVGVNCSEGEGLSNAIMEYMLYGIPCVVSTGGGNPDLIEDKVSGRTFAVGDHATLAESILDVLGDAAARDRYTHKAAQRVREDMSMETMVEHFSSIYLRAA